MKRVAAVFGVSGALLAGTATMAAAEPAPTQHVDTGHQTSQISAQGKTTGGFSVTAKRRGDSSAGQSWVRLTFRNKTGQTIRTIGWAGVSFVGHDNAPSWVSRPLGCRRWLVTLGPSIRVKLCMRRSGSPTRRR